MQCFFVGGQHEKLKVEKEKTPPNKSVAPKTMRKWWKKSQISALFIYLMERHQNFDEQFPMFTDDEGFVDNVLRKLSDTKKLLRFLGAYAYLADIFAKAHADLFYVPISELIPRIPISTSPFSKAELETISQYEKDKNYLLMAQEHP